MSLMDVGRLGLAIVIAAMIIPVRAWINKGNAGPLGLLDVAASPARLAAISGVAIGWGVPDWVRGELQPVPILCFVFFAGWSGLVAGSSLELRVSRRLTLHGIRHELLQAVFVTVAVTVLIWAVRFIPGFGTAPGRFHILTIAAICLLTSILPSRQLHRGGGAGVGFWDPSLLGPMALLLAAWAVAGEFTPTVVLQLPAPLSQQVSFELGGPVEQLLWSTVGGAITGLLMDLVTREDFAPGGLYVQMAAVALVCSGLGAMMGLSPLWLGAVAGFWSVSATLRRLDLLVVLAKGMALPRIAAPALAGWCVGIALVSEGLNWRVVGMVVAVIASVRPTVHIVAALVQRRRFSRIAGRRPRPIDPTIIEADEVSLVIAGAGGVVLSQQALPSLLLGVLLAQFLLAVGAQLGRGPKGASTPPRAGQESTQARPDTTSDVDDKPTPGSNPVGNNPSGEQTSG
ncbi:MAG: hypothetical protein CME05_10550 [Gemmatimonadaceae bacterium]|nr:hypothetical protein [Gemmatimonadaceae bacterium]